MGNIAREQKKGAPSMGNIAREQKGGTFYGEYSKRAKKGAPSMGNIAKDTGLKGVARLRAVLP